MHIKTGVFVSAHAPCTQGGFLPSMSAERSNPPKCETLFLLGFARL